LPKSGTSRHAIDLMIGMGGGSTLDSYGPGRSFDLVPPEHLAFLEGCLDFFETEHHIFVHASYEPRLPLAEQSSAVLRWESLRDGIPAPHCSGKTVITGHTAQKSGEILDLGYLKCIDTWCYGGGWLTALEVDSGQVWQVDSQGALRRT
jgi:serine/threonine protein phosphatase 1